MIYIPADALASGAETMGILSGSIGLLAVFSGLAIRSIKKFITAEVGAVKTEVTPNGGNTNQSGDRLVRLGQRVEDVIRLQSEQHESTTGQIAAIDGRFVELNNNFQQHIGEHRQLDRVTAA